MYIRIPRTSCLSALVRGYPYSWHKRHSTCLSDILCARFPYISYRETALHLTYISPSGVDFLACADCLKDGFASRRFANRVTPNEVRSAEVRGGVPIPITTVCKTGIYILPSPARAFSPSARRDRGSVTL